mgnify:FL=1
MLFGTKSLDSVLKPLNKIVKELRELTNDSFAESTLLSETADKLARSATAKYKEASDAARAADKIEALFT